LYDVLAILNLERILTQNRLTRAMTGLNRKAFEKLLPSFTEAYAQSQSKPVGETVLHCCQYILGDTYRAN
jgi:hypothetical protein